MTFENVQYADAGEITLAYETFGKPHDPAVVLVMGLATQMLGWPDGFCRHLADQGRFVIRFDNRDVGLSTHLDHLGVPDLTPLLRGELISGAPYLLSEMAVDTIGLMDALDLDRVHLVGGSMGGMIAQEVALKVPDRLLSLTSLFSTVAPWVGAPTPAATKALFIPPASSEQEAGERAVQVYRVIGSPGYELDEESLIARSREAFRRANDPAGVARQLAAIHASGDRTEQLRQLELPALVLHGEDDPLVQIEGGRATAAAIPGARLVTWPGMGHDLPEPLWGELVAEIAAIG